MKHCDIRQSPLWTHTHKMILYLAIAAFLLYATYRYQLLFKNYKDIDKMFPGKPTIPFLGNALDVFGDSHYVYNAGLELCILFRRTFRFWIGPLLFICILTPQDTELVLNNTVHIRKSRLYDFIIPWIKRGLLTSYGSKWKKNRKILTPAFHFKILDDFLEVFNKNGNILCQHFKKKVGLKSFNVFNFVKMCALDNVCETAMGVSVNAQENPTSEYAQAIKQICYIVFLRTMRPWLAPDIIFKLTSWGRMQKKALKTLHTFTMDVIEKRKEQRLNGDNNSLDDSQSNERGVRNKKAFLDLLLDRYDEGLLTLNEVQEEVDTFMFEGHDTITSALSFAMYNIANHPLFQERAYQEQKEIFGEDERDPNMDDLQRMKYLEMVIKESLRICPSVPVFGRLIEQDLKLDDNSTIPAGTEALLLVPGIHRNPDHWEHPNEFDPDRFLPENVAKRHPYSYIPFSAGPRNCIGMRFAMMEMKSTMSKVLRKFQLKPCDPQVDIRISVEVVLLSQTGAQISLEFRKK